MPGTSALATLLAGVLALWGIAHVVAGRAAASRPEPTLTRSDNPGTRLGAAAAVGVALYFLAPITPLPVYVVAASVAAISTAAAIGLGREIGAVFAAPAYAVPSLRVRPPSTRGCISGEAAVAAAAAAALTATLAFAVRLLGPSDGGPVFLAAMVGMLFERWLDGAWQPHGAARLAPTVIAGAVGASLAAAAVILLP